MTRILPKAEPPPKRLPLARYLPPIPPEAVTDWLARCVAPGSWLLDPLGASPTLVMEAARAGYHVITAVNNPILRFVIETLASAPTTADIQSAIAELAMARRGEERLEVHIRQLYTTRCDGCDGGVECKAFLWRKGEAQPYARIYTCPRCGESGERPVTQADLDRLAGMGGDTLLRSRALQRVLLNEEDHREDVEDALAAYLPRPLYVLFTILNKMEGLNTTPDRVRLLQALLISAFDAGNGLWPHPAGRARPKQLITPTQFRENNLWFALEDAAAEWARNEYAPISVTHWPERHDPSAQPSEAPHGSICLYHGRVKNLLPLPTDLQPAAIICAFPRPNQAFWTLSVVWTGWLWGAEAALPLRNILDRRRYDWNWHTTAIHSALAVLADSTTPETPFWGVLPELAPGFLSAALIAAEAAGFHMQSITLRSDLPTTEEPEYALAEWQTIPNPSATTMLDPVDASVYTQTAQAGVRADLIARAEPAPYLLEYAAALSAIARAGILPRTPNTLPADLQPTVQTALTRIFADPAFLTRLNDASDEEHGLWYLADPPGIGELLPLADRVEIEVVRYLQRHETVPFSALTAALRPQFPDLLFPPTALVQACLESYAERLPEDAWVWRLPAAETPAARRADLDEMRACLTDIGTQLGFNVQEGKNSLLWQENGCTAWQFWLMASSIISRYVFQNNPESNPPPRQVLVLPGSRARLLSLKLRRDPRLEAASQNWLMLKFRHLRRLAVDENLSRVAWEAALSEDPITDGAVQMSLFADPSPDSSIPSGASA